MRAWDDYSTRMRTAVRYGVPIVPLSFLKLCEEAGQLVDINRHSLPSTPPMQATGDTTATTSTFAGPSTVSTTKVLRTAHWFPYQPLSLFFSFLFFFFSFSFSFLFSRGWTVLRQRYPNGNIKAVMGTPPSILRTLMK